MIEDQIQADLTRLDASAAFLSGLAGYSQTKVSQGLSGVRRWSNDEFIRLLNTTDACKRLAALVAPIPISFKNPAVIRALLDQLEDGTLRICVDSPQVTPDKPPAFSVRWKDGRWFSHRKENGEIVLTMNFVGVTAMTSNVADQMLKILSDNGFDRCSKIRQAFPGDVITEIQAIWPSATPVEEGK